MPNPRLGTVTMDVKGAVSAAKGGQVEFRAEKAGIIHAGIGKVSFDDDKLVENAKALAETLKSKGLDIVSGGTDTHLMLVDLRPKRLNGKVAELALGRAYITCNKNGIPFDPETPFVTSGLRLGTPATTTRGFGVAEFQQVGGMIAEVLNALSQSPDGKAPLVEAAVKERVKALTDRFPIY